MRKSRKRGLRPVSIWIIGRLIPAITSSLSNHSLKLMYGPEAKSHGVCGEALVCAAISFAKNLVFFLLLSSALASQCFTSNQKSERKKKVFITYILLLMKALELNTEDPAFQDGWAVTVIEQATIARLKMFRPKQAAQAVKQFTDIANLFNSISSALETVEIEWIKMNAEPEPYSFLSFAPQWFFAPQSTSSSSSKTKTNKAMTEVELYQSQGHVVPFEVRKDLAYFDPYASQLRQQSRQSETEQQQIGNTS